MSGRFRRSAVAIEHMEPIAQSPSKARLSDRESIDYELMLLLEQRPDLSQRELSRRLGISLGRVNYCLQALAQKGWVKLENFRQSPNKQRYIYALTPDGRDDGAVFEAQAGRIRASEGSDRYPRARIARTGRGCGVMWRKIPVNRCYRARDTSGNDSL